MINRLATEVDRLNNLPGGAPDPLMKSHGWQVDKLDKLPPGAGGSDPLYKISQGLHIE